MLPVETVSVSSLSSDPWIINSRQDLTWFSGSALLGYGLIAIAFAYGGLPGKIVVAIALLIDGPHVYSTATRVVFDPNERKRLRFLWLALFPLCVLGPVVTLTLGFSWFFVFIAAWSHYHISKQHMGFVMIYKKKASERDDFKLDKYFTLASLILPFLYYLTAVMTGKRLMLLFLVPSVILTGYYGWHQLQKEQVNRPKLLLLAAFIPLQWLAWSYAAIEPHSPIRLLAAAVAVNIGHSFQYLRLIWLHNHNRYGTQNGLLGAISKKWIYFLGFAALLALPNHLSRYANDNLISAAMLGFLMFHFVVDAKIWRIRGDAQLANALGLGRTQPKPSVDVADQIGAISAA